MSPVHFHFFQTPNNLNKWRCIAEKVIVKIFFSILFLFCFISCENTYFISGESSTPDSIFEREEFIVNKDKSLVDILIVADSSPSMHHHLTSLGSSLSALLTIIYDYDWQIGITSAYHGRLEDSNDDWRRPESLSKASVERGYFGALMNLEGRSGLLEEKILTPLMPNYRDIFLLTLSDHSCLRPPYCHKGFEQPLRSLKSAIERVHLDNDSFFRPEADFVSLIITNEEERFEDQDNSTKAIEVIESFNLHFSNLKKKFVAFNILVTENNCRMEEIRNGNVASIAYSVSELAERTGGANLSICHSDYSQLLREISQHIKEFFEASFVLKKRPVPGTLVVELNGKESWNWQLYGQNLVLDYLPHDLANVSVSYRSQD